MASEVCWIALQPENLESQELHKGTDVDVSLEVPKKSQVYIWERTRVVYT